MSRMVSDIAKIIQEELDLSSIKNVKTIMMSSDSHIFDSNYQNYMMNKDIPTIDQEFTTKKMILFSFAQAYTGASSAYGIYESYYIKTPDNAYKSLNELRTSWKNDIVQLFGEIGSYLMPSEREYLEVMLHGHFLYYDLFGKPEKKFITLKE